MSEQKKEPKKGKTIITPGTLVSAKAKQAEQNKEDNNKRMEPVLITVYDPGAFATTGQVDGTVSEKFTIPIDRLVEKEKAELKAELEEGVYHDKENNIYLEIRYGNARRSDKANDPNDPNDCRIEFDGNKESQILGLHYVICPGGGKQIIRDTIKALKNKRWQFTHISLTPADGLDPEKKENGADLSDLLRFYINIGFEIQGDGTLIGEKSIILNKIEDLLTRTDSLSHDELADIEENVAQAISVIANLKKGKRKVLFEGGSKKTKKKRYNKTKRKTKLKKRKTRRRTQRKRK